MLQSLRLIARNSNLRIFAIILVSSGIVWSSTTPFLTILGIEHLKLSADTMSLLLFISGLATLIFGVLITSSFDLLKNPVPVAFFTLACGALGYGAIWLAPSPIVFFAVYVALIPVSSTTFDLLFACIRSELNAVDPGGANATSSTIRSLYALTWILVPIAVGFVVARTNVISAWLIGGLASALCLPLLLFIKGTFGTSKVGASHPVSILNVWRQVISVPVVMTVLPVSFMGSSQRLAGLVLPLVMLDRFKASAADVGLFVGLTAALEIPCMLAWAKVSQYYSVKSSLCVGAFFFAAFLLILGSADNLNVLYAAALINAAGLAAILSIPISYFHEKVLERPGLGSSMHVMMDFVATSFASVLFWFGLKFVGLAGTAFIASGFAVAGALAILLLPHWKILREPN
jgi:MFS transporter, SET family, sugar efflux transporter